MALASLRLVALKTGLCISVQAIFMYVKCLNASILTQKNDQKMN